MNLYPVHIEVNEQEVEPVPEPRAQGIHAPGLVPAQVPGVYALEPFLLQRPEPRMPRHDLDIAIGEGSTDDEGDAQTGTYEMPKLPGTPAGRKPITAVPKKKAG